MLSVLKVVIRIGISMVCGWYLLAFPMLIAGIFGLHAWGFFHSGLVLICLPFTICLAFWLLGFLPFLKVNIQTNEPRPTL